MTQKKLITKIDSPEQKKAFGLLIGILVLSLMIVSAGAYQMSEYDIDMNIYLLPIIFLLSTAQPFLLFLYFFKRRDIEWKIYKAILLTSMLIYPILAVYAVHTYFQSTFFTNINPWAWIEIAGLLLLSSIASLVAALLIQALMKVIPETCSSTLAIKRNDSALCRTSRGRFRVGVCLSELASFKNEPSICDHALKFLSNEKKKALREKRYA